MHTGPRAPSHFVLLNAQKLRDTQHMMQQILLSLVHALYEGNPQPVFANTEKLNECCGRAASVAR